MEVDHEPARIQGISRLATSAPLREGAAPECDTLLTAYQGDKVEILERNSEGWSRVRLEARRYGCEPCRYA